MQCLNFWVSHRGCSVCFSVLSTQEGAKVCAFYARRPKGRKGNDSVLLWLFDQSFLHRVDDATHEVVVAEHVSIPAV